MSTSDDDARYRGGYPEGDQRGFHRRPSRRLPYHAGPGGSWRGGRRRPGAGWLFGYFKWLWADSTLPMGVIDPAARTLTTAEAYDYHGGMDTAQGILWYAVNLIEELDRFDLSRADGLIVTDSEHFLIADCTGRRFVGNGITIDGSPAGGLR